ncbi:MAG: hypothetical protein LJE85_06190 [Gammaproteobacteria bacterium]|jgi:hypothetical protein|nr:hypothetical protein [Gammaproteobacteria bacterium]
MAFSNHKELYWVVTFFIALILSTSNFAYAANSWSVGLTPQLLMSQYSGSEERDTLTSYGVMAKADYLDNGGLTLGYNFTAVRGKALNPDIDETSWYISGRAIRYSDLMAGKVGLRLDGYAITDKSTINQPADNSTMRPNRPGSTSSTFTDNVSVMYAQLDYKNYGDRFYADIAYAYSDYDYETNTAPYRDNQVQQFTTTAVMAFNDSYDLLQTRFYFIRLDHGDNTGGVDHSNALEFKWLHWFQPNAPLNVNSSLVKLLAGKRLYPVDPDAATTYSISDLQTSSVAAGLDWKLGELSKIFLLIGYDHYDNPQINDTYSTRYIFGSLLFNW